MAQTWLDTATVAPRAANMEQRRGDVAVGAVQALGTDVVSRHGSAIAFAAVGWLGAVLTSGSRTRCGLMVRWLDERGVRRDAR